MPGGRLSEKFAGFVSRNASALAAFSAALAIAAAVMAVRFGSDPVEYDFSKLGSRRGVIDGAGYWGKRLDAVMRSYGTPTVILSDTPGRAEAVAAALTAEKRAQGAASSIDTIVSLQRLLPADQETKLALLREIISSIDDKVLRSLPAGARERVANLRKTTQLTPVRLEDVPALYREMFREKDGQTGKLTLVYPTLAMTSRQGRLQLGFARTLREAAQRADPEAQVAGPLILTADIIETITHGCWSCALSAARPGCWVRSASARSGWPALSARWASSSTSSTSSCSRLPSA